MSTSKSTVERPVPSLNTLPPEIREQIWLLSFSPRTIQLHVHHHQRYARKQKPRSQRWTKLPPPRRMRCTGRLIHPNPRAKKLVGVSFTATLVGEGQFPRFYKTVEEWSEANPSSGFCPAAPAQLHVCRESRALALRRYQLAFPGRDFTAKKSAKASKTTFDKAWINQQLGKSKIWFDFDRDTLLLYRSMEPSRTGVVATSLEATVRHAHQDIVKIKNLGLGIYTCHVVSSVKLYGLGYDVQTHLKLFTNLDDLTLYDLSQGRFEPADPTSPYRGPPTMSIEHLTSILDSAVRKHFQRFGSEKSTEVLPMPHLTVLRIPKL